MAVLDARNADEIFRMSTNSTVKFAAHLSHSTTSYKWRTAGADDILATGSGIVVNPANRPTAGTITRLTIDFSRDDTARTNDIDVTITGLRAPLRTLAGAPPPSASSTPNADLFWKTLLSGNDVIYAPLRADATMSGDFVQVATGSATAGNDRMFSGNLGGQVLIGDALTVGPGVVGGGSAMLDAGDDRLIATNIRGLTTLIGDVERVELGSARCGNDVITGSNARPDLLIGDVRFVIGEDGFGGASGGSDQLFGRGGADTIIGDFFGAGGEAGFGCGADIIHGGDGNDTIFGDVKGDTDFQGEGRLVCGNDTLYGDAGNDTIYGDAVSVETLGDFGFDGSDRLFGGAGADTLFGDSQGSETQGARADILDGGTGNDNLTGGPGIDRFVFQASAGNDRILDFTDDVDQINIAASYGLADAAAVVAATSADGNDAVVNLGGGNSVRLVGYLAGHTIASLENDVVVF